MEEGINRVILSSAYLAPVQYFTKLVTYDEVWIELREHFLKQSYRNRCIILTANGIQSLSIPVAEGSNSKRMIRDVALSYDHPWQKLHWRAIISAYNNAPFFEYYCDSLAPFYHEKRWKFLADFNLEVQSVILQEMNAVRSIRFTEEFILPGNMPPGTADYRYSIHPKISRQANDENFRPVAYMQVFQEKFGFTPNLSIIDLLFNEGPMALKVLRDSVKSV